MNETKKADGGMKANQDLLTDIFREIGTQVGHRFHRLILHGEGGGEAEFDARNPWESLVIRWEDGSGLSHLLNGKDGIRALFEQAVVRKKCAKCFLHERKAGQGDVRLPNSKLRSEK